MNFMKDQDKDEALLEQIEKLAILNLLMSNEFERYLDYNTNPLPHLFECHLKSNEKGEIYQTHFIKQIFEKKSEEYRNYFKRFLHNDFKRISLMPQKGRHHIESCKIFSLSLNHFR